jgi:hypothetical protein
MEYEIIGLNPTVVWHEAPPWVTLHLTLGTVL